MKYEVDSQHAVEGVTGRCPANCDVTPRQWSNSRHGHACALFHHLTENKAGRAKNAKKEEGFKNVLITITITVCYITTVSSEIISR